MTSSTKLSKLNPGCGILSVNTLTRLALLIKVAHVLAVIVVFSWASSNFITKDPKPPPSTTMTNRPNSSSETESVVGEVFLFILGYNYDHGVLIFSSAVVYGLLESVAILLFVCGICSDRPRFLWPEIGLSVAYGILHSFAGLVLFTTIAMFGVEWLVQMMANSTSTGGGGSLHPLTNEHVAEIRRRMPSIFTAVLLGTLGVSAFNFYYAVILYAFGSRLADEDGSTPPPDDMEAIGAYRHPPSVARRHRSPVNNRSPVAIIHNSNIPRRN